MTRQNPYAGGLLDNCADGKGIVAMILHDEALEKHDKELYAQVGLAYRAGEISIDNGNLDEAVDMF